jgi:hypothetical protein
MFISIEDPDDCFWLGMLDLESVFFLLVCIVCDARSHVSIVLWQREQDFCGYFVGENVLGEAINGPMV